MKSSIENCPLVPELIITKSSFNLSIALAVALEFINAEINIVFALKLLLIALVPLVVLNTTVFHSTYFFVYSKGELENLNPSIFKAFLSPPKIMSSLLF